MNHCQSTNMNWAQFYEYWKTTKSNILLKKNDFTYQTTKSTKSLKIITTNHCEVIQMYSKHYSFYDKFINFSTWNNTSKFTSENVLIVKRINITFMLNTTKFNIRNHRNRHEMKSRWILSSNYQNRKIQQQS